MTALPKRVHGTITRISQSEGKSAAPAISADGRYVAYETWARDWDPGDANAASDGYIKDGAPRASH